MQNRLLQCPVHTYRASCTVWRSIAAVMHVLKKEVKAAIIYVACWDVVHVAGQLLVVSVTLNMNAIICSKLRKLYNIRILSKSPRHDCYDCMIVV